MNEFKRAIGYILLSLGIFALAITVIVAAYSEASTVNLLGVFLVEACAIWGGFFLIRR